MSSRARSTAKPSSDQALNVDHPFARRLALFGALPEEDLSFLRSLVRAPRDVPARTNLIREGEVPGDLHLVVAGFACCYKILRDGHRHIMAYLVPGDLSGLRGFLLGAADNGVATLGPARIVAIPRARALEMTARPALAHALAGVSLVDAAMLRAWLVNLGQRSAEERIGHLLCELHLRLQNVGLASENRFSLPVTQMEVADTTGLTPVHVNRILQSLRRQKLISWKSREVVLHEPERLRRFSGFDPGYLHLTTKN